MSTYQKISETGFVIGHFDPYNVEPEVVDGMIDDFGGISKADPSWGTAFNEADKRLTAWQKARAETKKPPADTASLKRFRTHNRERVERAKIVRSTKQQLRAAGQTRLSEVLPKTTKGKLALAAVPAAALAVTNRDLLHEHGAKLRERAGGARDVRRYRPASMYYDDYLGKADETISKARESLHARQTRKIEEKAAKIEARTRAKKLLHTAKARAKGIEPAGAKVPTADRIFAEASRFSQFLPKTTSGKAALAAGIPASILVTRNRFGKAAEDIIKAFDPDDTSAKPSSTRPKVVKPAGVGSGYAVSKQGIQQQLNANAAKKAADDAAAAAAGGGGGAAGGGGGGNQPPTQTPPTQPTQTTTKPKRTYNSAAAKATRDQRKKDAAELADFRANAQKKLARQAARKARIDQLKPIGTALVDHPKLPLTAAGMALGGIGTGIAALSAKRAAKQAAKHATPPRFSDTQKVLIGAGVPAGIIGLSERNRRKRMAQRDQYSIGKGLETLEKLSAPKFLRRKPKIPVSGGAPAPAAAAQGDKSFADKADEVFDWAKTKTDDATRMSLNARNVADDVRGIVNGNYKNRKAPGMTTPQKVAIGAGVGGGLLVGHQLVGPKPYPYQQQR